MYGFRLDVDHPARPTIATVEASSSAATAGLKPGDVITTINNVAVTSVAAAQQILTESFGRPEPLKLRLAGGDRQIEMPAVDPPAESRPVHPAQVYSAIDAALLAWLLWSYYPFRHRDGEVIALLLTIHPISRFLLEIIRTDEPAIWGTGLSISQNISILIFVVAVGLWIYVLSRPRHLAWAAAGPA